MSDIEEEVNNGINDVETGEIIPLDLYMLWRSRRDQQFTIQARFTREAKFPFALIARLSDGKTQDQNPCVYRLHLDLIKNADGQLTVKHKNTLYPAKSYLIRISQPGHVYTSHFEENTPRPIHQVDDVHYFLFDVVFKDSPPGERISFWKNLCLFTYYLIDSRQVDMFELFFEQFSLFMHNNPSEFTKSDFINFVKTTFAYFSNKERILDHPLAIINIVRMIGILPVKRRNFHVTDDYARKLCAIILKKLSEQLSTILENMNAEKWNVFMDGLGILMSIDVLNNEDINTECRSISLLYRIPSNDNKQRQIANRFLERLIILELPIQRMNWIELLSFVDDKNLTIDCVRLAASFDHILCCFERLISLHEMDDDLSKTFTIALESKLDNNIISIINLSDIVKILQYLEQQPMTTAMNDKHVRLIQLVLESNVELRRHIMKYLKNLNVQVVHLKLLYDLFHSYNPSLLPELDQTIYLISILNGHDKRSCDFYTVWFECFLCDEHYVQTEQEFKLFQQLLKEWSKIFLENQDLLEEITMKINILLQKLTIVVEKKSNDRRLIYFINHMINIYLQKNQVFDVIANFGSYIENTIFLDIFVGKFLTDYINPNRKFLKLMKDYNNPIYRLMSLRQRQSQMSNVLLLRLLDRCSTEIQPDDDELLCHSFLNPAFNTCTEAILFDDSFSQCPIRYKTLDRLAMIWSTWEDQKLTYEQVRIKKQYNPEQEHCFNKVWKAVGDHSEKQYHVAVLFETAYKELIEKTRTKEKISTCLNEYCDQATDRQDYTDLLVVMQQQIELSMISEIHVPPQLRKVMPFVERLIPFLHANAWLQFYTNHVHKPGKHSKNDQIREKLLDVMAIEDDHCSDRKIKDADDCTETNDTWVKLDILSDQRHNNINATVITTTDALPLQTNNRYTCIDVLTQATKILDLFQRELQAVCVNWSNASFQQLTTLFPDVQSAENDVHILKPFIEPDTVPKLLAILNFRKQRSQLAHILRGLKNLFNLLQLSVDKDSNTVISILADLLTINEQTFGQLCFGRYQRYITICAERYSTKVLDLWSHYSSSRDVIEFLHKLTTTEMESLLEVVNDWDETLVSTKIVMDFDILKKFFDQVHTMIKNQQTPKSTSTTDYIATVFENVSREKDFQHILDYFPACSSSLPAMERLYLELTDKGQLKRQRIIDIMRKSSIRFQQNAKKKYEFNVRLKPQNLVFADLIELRDRARLIEYSERNKPKKDAESKIEQLQTFIVFVNIIERALKTLSSLFIAGHLTITAFRLKEMSASVDGKFHELQQLCIKLERDLDVWQTELYRVYEVYPELTYFFCEQLQAVENIMDNNDKTRTGFHLLKYIGLETEQLALNSLPEKSNPQESIARLVKIGQILARQRVNLRDHASGKKVWLVETTEEGVLHGLFSLFHLTKNPPRVHQLFYCTERTNWTEIRAFVYRCFFSKTLQILIRPHLLSPDIQHQFMPLLQTLMLNGPTRMFYLGIIATAAIQNIQLINALKMLNIVTTLRDQDLLGKTDFAENLKAMLRHCTLVTSRLAGLGKTTFIRERYQSMSKPLIKFSVGGDVQADEIAERLRNQTIELQTFALHIDIGPVDNIRTLDEILYCLTLFQSFRFGQIAISLPKDTPIFLELDSSPFAIKGECLTICQYLESIHHLEHVHWQELHHHLPKIQFVANYLDEISRETIVKLDINAANVRRIDGPKCLQLIKTQFLLNKNPEFITWTQLNIFIAVFYTLFDGFSKCGYFLVDALQNSQLRLDILQTFLRSSDQFTSLSVENVRKHQRASTVIDGNMKVQPPVLSNTVVRWETTQPFTVVFSATNDPLFVYKTVKNVPESLIHAFRTFQRASVSQIRMRSQAKVALLTRMTTMITETFSDASTFPDYSRLSHIEFFIKLASLSYKFFNKAVCQKCFKQFPYTTLHCTFCATREELLRPKTFDNNDIVVFQHHIARLLESQYVLTPDNYIKMLLIFLRVQSGLPVLIMGETGCGKTALVTFLCQIILDDELEIFRMHAGINAEKISEKMSVLIDTARECEAQQKRLWVFFDEFNTTHSIAIIKEITCERTLLGKSLPENMVFLGACNPRRYKPDQVLFDNNVGIKKNRYDVEQLQAMSGEDRLLYTVVPLPETMLEYVWDYGFLDPDTEKKYIATMLKTCTHLSSHEKWFKTSVTLISESQAYIRRIEDVSSVSLRDVARFRQLFNWFHTSILTRINTDDQPLIVLRRAIMSALLLCYYFRLKSIAHKQEYIRIVE